LFAGEEAEDGRADDEGEHVNECMHGHGGPDGAGEEVDEGHQQADDGGGDDSDGALIDVGEAEEQRGEGEGRNGVTDENGKQQGQQESEVKLLTEAGIEG
jgi:hypothetical protein